MKTIAELIEHYRALETRFEVTDRVDLYSSLVTASTTSEHPVQRWFHFKEAFALDLLETVVSQWNICSEDVNRILDPFCGTGTSILAAFAKMAGRFVS
jgi:hypothetical protein